MVVGDPAAVVGNEAALMTEASGWGRQNAKIEDNQVTNDFGASISALDCLSWDFYGREK